MQKIIDNDYAHNRAILLDKNWTFILQRWDRSEIYPKTETTSWNSFNLTEQSFSLMKIMQKNIP